MFRRTLRHLARLALSLASLATPVHALEDARLLRMPDLHGERIVFVHGGDLWMVARSGGTAQRLTSHPGLESFPKFSPDGTQIAFTGEYDGNPDVYVMPTAGGAPRRLTFHPGDDHVTEWYPDGQAILVRGNRNSPFLRLDQFSRLPLHGGITEALPLWSAGYAGFSEDGRQLAFVSPQSDRRLWKRYRGGNAADIHVYDFDTKRSENITADWVGPDEWPMFHGRTIYYVSDRDGHTANLWAYDRDRHTHQRITSFTEFDVKWPSIGPDGIVFENGGALWVMDLPSERAHPIKVTLPDDEADTRPRYRNVAAFMGGCDLSPTGQRAVIEVRGDLFTLSPEPRTARNLTRTPGVRERDPAWSPDGQWLAYWSDAGGEYQLMVSDAEGRRPARTLTQGVAPQRYELRWSPDSRKLAWSDKTGRLWWFDVEHGRATQVDQDVRQDVHDYTWSPDSRWLAYSKQSPTYLRQIYLHCLASGRTTCVSDGMNDDYSPSFDPEGRWLYFVSWRTLMLAPGHFEKSMSFQPSARVYALALTSSVGSPLRRDDPTSETSGAAVPLARPNTPPHRIELDGLGERIVELPIPAGDILAVRGARNRVFYTVRDQAPDESEYAPVSIGCYTLASSSTHLVVRDVDEPFAVSQDGTRLLYRRSGTVGIVSTTEEHATGDGALPTDDLMAWVDLRAEWLQIYNESWRIARDYFYDPGMNGIDWKAIGDRYRPLVAHVSHRNDLNYVLSEMLGELSTSHLYVSGGDMPETPEVNVGLLGVDWGVDERTGYHRFARIYRERDWNSSVVPPLAEPGLDVREGDLLLAVNGRPVKLPTCVFEPFGGTVGHPTELLVARSADDPAPRVVTVTPIADDMSLRYAAWVRDKRERVARATQGRVGYVHIPTTTYNGFSHFAKDLYAEAQHEALIVDDRFNRGGVVPDFFIRALTQRTWNYASNRDGQPWYIPDYGLDGPQCLLINSYAGSGGDLIADLYRQAKLGPLIGRTTGGNLVGTWRWPTLIDGGQLSVPDFGLYDTEGRWIGENHGVEPDLDVDNAPESEADGSDPQLDRAIEWTLEQLRLHPVKRPITPAFRRP